MLSKNINFNKNLSRIENEKSDIPFQRDEPRASSDIRIANQK